MSYLEKSPERLLRDKAKRVSVAGRCEIKPGGISPEKELLERSRVVKLGQDPGSGSLPVRRLPDRLR